MTSKVIARADRGEPLERIAMETGRRVVYLANPARIAAVEVGDGHPIGFPIEGRIRVRRGGLCRPRRTVGAPAGYRPRNMGTAYALP